MTANCPLCGSRVYSLHTLRWQDALRQLPSALKQQAMRQQGDRTPNSGRWLYATRQGTAICISPDQASLIVEDAPFGEDHED